MDRRGLSNKDSLKKAILKFKPDIVLKGNEHESYENDEESIVKTYGGKLYLPLESQRFHLLT